MVLDSPIELQKEFAEKLSKANENILFSHYWNHRIIFQDDEIWTGIIKFEKDFVSSYDWILMNDGSLAFVLGNGTSMSLCEKQLLYSLVDWFLFRISRNLEIPEFK
jgi:hypothetical protein